MDPTLYSAQYHRLDTDDDDENSIRENITDLPQDDLPRSFCQAFEITDASKEGKLKGRWSHVDNLDYFFQRVYRYFHEGGFWCIVLLQIFSTLKLFLVFSAIGGLWHCVDYGNLFKEDQHFHDIILPLNQCVARFSALEFVIISGVLLVSCVYNLVIIGRAWNIRQFYIEVLEIQPADLVNWTWHEVLLQLLKAQNQLLFSVKAEQVTQLDIYHRILRFENYEVAMINKGLLPLKCRLPVIGEFVFFTSGMRLNLRCLLFWGPWSFFQNHCTLKQEYKQSSMRKDLARCLQIKILVFGLLNIVLSPIIFVWRAVYTFLRYPFMFKQSPSKVGMRRWSLYGRTYLRHYNELDHELDARLRRAYRPANKYVGLFFNREVVIIAKNLSFYCVAIGCLIFVGTVINEEAFSRELGIAVLCIILYTVFQALIPDENAVNNPQLLMDGVLAHVHYMPDEWRGKAHTVNVYNEFSQLFQYLLVMVLQEVLGPLVSGFLLIYYWYPRSEAIVDFFYNFTVHVEKVGDVCSFAQMDVRHHGNPEWVDQTEADKAEQAEGGKTELSLMHFTVTNPEWKPSNSGLAFMDQLKHQIHRDTAGPTSHFTAADIENPLVNSIYTMTSSGEGYTSLLPNIAGGFPANRTSFKGPGIGSSDTPLQPVGSGQTLLATVQESMLARSMHGELNPALSIAPRNTAGLGAPVTEDTLEHMSMEMSFAALYMHELHRARKASSRLHTPTGDTQTHEETRIDLEEQSRALFEGAALNYQSGVSDSSSHGRPPSSYSSYRSAHSSPDNLSQRPSVGVHLQSMQMPHIVEDQEEEAHSKNERLPLMPRGNVNL